MRKKPNIVYILSDDMGYGDVSCLNPESRIRTPTLDRMAAEGMIFRDAHASSSVCTPSRYSILTGRYNWRSSLKRSVTDGYSPPLIDPGRMTVASMLKDHGYKTGCIGKWHLGWDWEKRSDDPQDVDFTVPIRNGPTEQGFDTFFGISASLDMPPYVYIENDRVTALPNRIIPRNEGMAFWREGPIAPDFRHEDVLPRLTREAEDFIDRNADHPFFLYFALPAPHTPIMPTDTFQGRSGIGAYGDFCLQCDDGVGRILSALERHGIADDTLLIFTADNGCSPMADFENLARFGHLPSYVFRGYKADIYEGGHRIPLILRWPKATPAGSICDETVCLVDLMASCAELVGAAPLPPDAAEDSISNLSLWRGAQPGGTRPLRPATVHHAIDGSFAIRAGDWKLEMCPGSGGWSFPRPGPECCGLPPAQLYNLRTDVGERHNLIHAHPDIAARLQHLLIQYIEDGRSTPGPKQENFGGPAWRPHQDWNHSDGEG